MSLSSLPDELVLKIMSNLFDREHVNDHLWNKSVGYYMDFGLTCKRFLKLAEDNYSQLAKIDIWKYEHVLRNCILDQRVTTTGIPESFGVCPTHMLPRETDKCFYRKLYPVMSFKYIRPRSIIITDCNLREPNCFLEINNYKFDNITRLILFNLYLDARVLSLLLQKLKNLDSLLISKTYRHRRGEASGSRETSSSEFDPFMYKPVPDVERHLKFIFFESTGSRNDAASLLNHPNINVSAKTVWVGLNGMSIEESPSSLPRRVFQIEYIDRHSFLMESVAFLVDYDSPTWEAIATRYRSFGLQVELKTPQDDPIKAVSQRITKRYRRLVPDEAPQALRPSKVPRSGG